MLRGVDLTQSTPTPTPPLYLYSINGTFNRIPGDVTMASICIDVRIPKVIQYISLLQHTIGSKYYPFPVIYVYPDKGKVLLYSRNNDVFIEMIHFSEERTI